VQGTFALTIEGRGFASHVVASQDESFLASECVSCGACVQACPTTALLEKSIIEKGQPERSVVTTCAYCGVGCSFRAEVRGEEIVRMVPHIDGKANHGHSCVKGRFAIGYATHSERITTPMIRASINDPWQEVSWDTAIAHTARNSAASGRARTRCNWRHHLLALHQRGNLARAETRARRVWQQQCRYLRAGLPFPDRLWLESHARRIGRHPGFRFGR
jgi:predicted molibdopterin-dependent oxidoreductase YjgC